MTGTSPDIPAVPETLVFGWGNPSRGDDALGPLAVEAIEAFQRADVECLTDFQLQVEHAMDLHGRRRVLFIDASASAPPPFTVSTLHGRADASYTTHEMSPEAVLHVYASVFGPPPPAVLLAVRGDVWELGQDPTATALGNLAAALSWVRDWLAEPAAEPETPPEAAAPQ